MNSRDALYKRLFPTWPDQIYPTKTQKIIQSQKGIRMQNLLPFDFQKALDGHPIVTRDGRSARLLSDKLDPQLKWPVLCAIEGVDMAQATKPNGLFDDVFPNDNDLFLMPKSRKVWIVQYKNGGMNAVDDHDLAKKLAADLQATIHAVEIPSNL